MLATCRQARADVAYELYLGDDTSAQQTLKTNYLTASADAVYGWQNQACTSTLQYICEMPPAPPPLPPSPPSPPIAAICECLHAAARIMAIMTA